jgi:hypothetical protein
MHISHWSACNFYKSASLKNTFQLSRYCTVGRMNEYINTVHPTLPYPTLIRNIIVQFIISHQQQFYLVSMAIDPTDELLVLYTTIRLKSDHSHLSEVCFCNRLIHSNTNVLRQS